MRKFRTIVTAVLGTACIAAACASAALWNAEIAAEAHTAEISMNDFDETSFVYTAGSQSSGSSVVYSFADGESLSMADKTGIAVRVKNLSGANYSIFQVYVYVENSTLVYSPYNATATFYWMSGGITTTKHATAARYIIIPANFDGYMFLDFTEMVVVRTSASSSFVFNLSTRLSADGEGDFALPTGNYNKLGFFTLSSYAGKELMFGGHTTYTGTGGGCVLDSARASADLSTAALLSNSYPLADVRAVSSLTCTFTGDEHVTFAEPSQSVPYGYSLTVPARFQSGYTQGAVTVGQGDGATVQSTLAVANTYRENATLSVSVQSRKIVLDSSARVLDPDDNGTASANYGGILPLENGISGVGADGVFVRVRNTQNAVYTVNTLYINGENGVQYSLLNTLATYVSADGSVSTNRPASGSVRNRMAKIPALFDGYLVIPFSELVATHVDNNIQTTPEWTRGEEAKLVKGSSDPWLAYPKCDLTSIHLYFTAGGGNEGRNELILGDFGTYVGEAESFTATQTAPFSSSVTSLTANGGLVTVSAFPETQLSVTLKINGTAATSDETADLGVQNTQCSLTYGQALSLSPVTKLGYALTRIEYSGAESGTLDRAVYVNLVAGGGELELNFVTEETAQATVSEGNIPLADKAGVKVSVANASGSPIDWRLVLTDGEAKYTASADGAGLIEENGRVKYANVFSVPANFSGTLYIPFNVYRGSLYGGIQLLPFDYAEGEKPASVTGKIYIDCLSGQSKTEIEAAFSDWEYVTALPVLSLAECENADLNERGDGDFVGGTSVSPLNELTATNAGSGKAFRITPAESLSFAGAGLALRIRNISGADFGLRIYVIASNGKTYVPQTKNPYTLIAADGSAQTATDTNRNVIVPQGFDGTVVVHFADYATDTAAADLRQNVVRDGLTVRYINLYSAGSSEGILVGNGAVIGYDGAVTEFSSGFATVGENTPGNFTLREVTAAPVTVNNESVSLSRQSVIYGVSAVTLTAAEGKLITGVTVPDECTAARNADGTYTVTVTRPIASAATEYAVSASVDDALTVSVEIEGSGKVYYLGEEISESIVVPLNGGYTLSVVADAGFEAAVTADGVPVAAAEEVSVPAGTARISVVFSRLQSELSVTAGGNGSATLGGEALSAGRLPLDQGVEYLLSVVPDRGYKATVTLNGAPLEQGENGYAVVLYENGTLEISFAPEVYRIAYDVDRGTNGDNPATYTVNDGVTFAAASKEGYTFLYWYVLENGEEVQITEIKQGSVGDITVYAKFQMIAAEGEAPARTNVWIWLGPVLGVAAVAAGVTVFVLVRRKRRK